MLLSHLTVLYDQLGSINRVYAFIPISLYEKGIQFIGRHTRKKLPFLQDKLIRQEVDARNVRGGRNTGKIDKKGTMSPVTVQMQDLRLGQFFP